MHANTMATGGEGKQRPKETPKEAPKPKKK